MSLFCALQPFSITETFPWTKELRNFTCTSDLTSVLLPVSTTFPGTFVGILYECWLHFDQKNSGLRCYLDQKEHYNKMTQKAVLIESLWNMIQFEEQISIFTGQSDTKT